MGVMLLLLVPQLSLGVAAVHIGVTAFLAPRVIWHPYTRPRCSIEVTW